MVHEVDEVLERYAISKDEVKGNIGAGLVCGEGLRCVVVCTLYRALRITSRLEDVLRTILQVTFYKFIPLSRASNDSCMNLSGWL